MWFIVIKCLISLPCIFSSCQGVNISVSLHPEGQLNLRYGEPLEMFCVAEQNTAKDLEFFIGGEHVDSEIVNSTTRRLYKENLKRQVIVYYCKNNITKRKCTSRVLIDGPPSNVTDFSCISKNIEELNCTWSKVGNLSITNYTLTLLINNVPSIPCPLTREGEKWLCSLNTSSRPRYQQMDDAYYFQLTTCNVFGCNEQNFTINHHSIVKPDRPDKPVVFNEKPHSVELKWNIPFNMAHFLTCSIVHRIEYQIAKIDNTSYFRSVDTSSLVSKPNKNQNSNSLRYTFLLSNLPYAHRSYEVRIYIRPELATEDRYWSDFSYAMFTTASERPQRPPETIVGAFFQSLYEKHRLIYVYWKQLEEYEEAGANFTYKVVVKQGSRNPVTKLSDKNKSLSYVELDASFDAIDISIWSINAVGSSVNSSHLYIPAKQDTEVLKVYSFTKLAYENGTYKLSWVRTENIDNYTLFWCQHNASQVCAGRMNFTVLDRKKDTHVIDLPREHRYQFAISANRGSKTSGMIWAICDISKEAIPMYGIPVKLDHDAAGKSHVRITWTMSCTLQPGMITGYLISYCPVVNTTSDCVSSENKSLHYINDPKQMAINITDLKPYTTYQFALAMNTTYGLKTIENASTGVTTTEDTPTSPRNVQISDVQFSSLNVSWDPPIQENGIIGNYVILDNKQQIHVEKIPDKEKYVTHRPVKVVGLKPYTNYTIRVMACNTGINSCSVPSPPEGIFVRTRIGPPSTLRAPTVKGNPGLLTWEPPSLPGGTVDRYDIMRVKDENSNETIMLYNTTDLKYTITHCEGVVNSVYYQVRAVNFDTAPSHGILEDSVNVIMPESHSEPMEFYGEWSDPSTVTCNGHNGITMTLILLAVFVLIGVLYGSIKLVKVVRKMEDIDPVLPNGLGIPEKDISKYAFGGLYSTNKDEKPSSDEMLLLPSRTTVSTPENKDNVDNNCGSSDHTDSTALSDTSRGPIERHASTSDDGSDSSLHLEVEPVRIDDNNASHDEEESSNSETDSRESSPDFVDKDFKKSPSGYVQSMIKPVSGYVQSSPAPPMNSLAKPAPQSAGSSYVKAALSPPIFTTGVAPPNIQHGPPASSAYVRPEDVQARSMTNFPKIGPTPTKVFGSESLPTMPTLPQPVKHGADSSYIQLQSLDALTSHKQPVRSGVSLQPPVSSGYVSPGDAVINKHLSNMLSGGHVVEEPAILDPTMSPDAYCRFSWSTDPANDNLHSLLADSHTLKSSKN